MFIQAVSMYCNKEQYEADLRKPLLDMGYEEICVTLWEICPVITNNGGDRLGEVTNIFHSTAEKYNRYFIDHYNPKLFLALAAMRKTEFSPSGNYFSVDKGEWVKHIKCNTQKMISSNDALLTELWKKMTKEELIEKFTIIENKEPSPKSIENVLLSLEHEQAELELKIDKLESFIKSGKFRLLGHIQKDLIIMQKNIMRSYNDCLIARIRNISQT